MVMRTPVLTGRRESVEGTWSIYYVKPLLKCRKWENLLAHLSRLNKSNKSNF